MDLLNNDIDSNGAIALAEALEHNEVLGIFIQASPLIEASIFQTLRTLSLQANPIGDAGIVPLAAMLMVNQVADASSPRPQSSIL